MILKTVLTACALGALTAAPAFADDAVHVIPGPGGNVCKVFMSKTHETPGMGGVDETEFNGRTQCDQPLTQTAHAFVPAGPGDTAGTLDGGTCSGFRTACTSGGSQRDQGDYGMPMVYDITLTATSAWPVAPSGCTGGGTTRLSCRFTVDDGLLWFRVIA